MENNRSFYLCFTLGLTALISVLSFPYFKSIYYPLLNFYDLAFHASAAVGFARAGGLTFNNFWAPLPSSELFAYLPLFPVIELFFLSSGASPFFLTFWLSWALLPLSFIAIFLFTYKAYGAKTSAYTVVLLSLSPLWLVNQWGRPPQGLVYVLTPLIFLALVKERYIILSALLLFSLGTHSSGFFLPFFLILYALQNKDKRRPLLAIAFIGLLISYPFIWLAMQHLKDGFVFISLNRGGLVDSFAYSLRRLFSLRSEAHAYLGWLAAGGLVICCFKRKNFLILPSYFFALFPLAWTTQEMRFWGIPALFIFSLLGGVALASFHEWIEKSGLKRLKGIFIFIAIFLTANFLFYFSSLRPPQIRIPAALQMINTIISKKSGHPKYSIFSKEDRARLVQLVKQYVPEDELFWINSSRHINNFVAAFSGRSTILSPSLGVMPGGVRLVVDRKKPSQDYLLAGRVNKEFYAYLYSTFPDRRVKKVKVPRPLITTKTLKAIFFFLGLLMIIDFFDLAKKLFFVLSGKKSRTER